jgi:hypothetical protein
LPSSLSTEYTLSTFISNNYSTSENSDLSYLDFGLIPIAFQTENIAGKESDFIDLYKNSRRDIAFLDGGKSIAYIAVF